MTPCCMLSPIAGPPAASDHPLEEPVYVGST
eukprot:CAMPEP_0202860846 /NCGR_PEP_ID=MMETSP1391-20130828/2437_1 /ASSEMBLY_ACC=CAM_ASM_000867 /TAXON_ID=1034604 /ORGANISM="Chlamydomonas leiostraca, Strain SAG 11-49" /LENGTH=30 /DNA_ID= /DNA_START= /DNA_END= /DNA_ORIENTATION=